MVFASIRAYWPGSTVSSEEAGTEMSRPPEAYQKDYYSELMRPAWWPESARGEIKYGEVV